MIERESCKISTQHFKRSKKILLDEKGASTITAKEFRCSSCGIQWNDTHMSSYSKDNIDTISCSNCYGDNVVVISIAVRYPKSFEKD